jgi:hypothetical protein
MYDDDKEEATMYKSGKGEDDSNKSKQEKSEFDTLVEEKGEKPKYDKSSQHGSHESFEPAPAQNDFFVNKELMQKMEEAEKKKKEELEKEHKHRSKSSDEEDEHKEKSIEEKINEAIQRAKSS